jgi:hypothetical protein
MKKFEHKKFGKLEVLDFTTKQYQEYSTRIEDAANKNFVVFRIELVKACLELGMIKCEPELTSEGVDNEKPNRVMWLADKTAEAIAEAVSIDPLD